MEKITNLLPMLKKRFYQNRKQTLEKKFEFIKSYRYVYEENLKLQAKKELDKLKASHHEILLPLELSQLENNQYLEIMTKEALDALNQTYTLKLKALKQTFKRKGIDQTDPSFIQKDNELNKAHDEKKQNILAMHERSLTDYQIKGNQKEYFDKEKELEQIYIEKERELQDKNLKLLNTFIEKEDVKVKKLESRINKLSESIKEHTIKIELEDASSDNLLILKNLTMKFGGLVAVNDLSFSVKKGEIFGLIGPNGAGKTTVFNCITQFYKPTAGDIYYLNRNQEYINLNDYKVHNVIKEGIARTFQNVEMVWELSVLDNMLVGSHSKFNTGFFSHLVHNKQLKREENVLRAKAIDILTKLGIASYMHYYPFGLPYGILKKIELARTLMTNPSLIILDEPAAGLNDSETMELAKTIKQIQKDYHCTIFLVEHDMGLVMDICDTICAISFGKKLAIGTPKEIQANHDVQTAYLGGE